MVFISTTRAGIPGTSVLKQRYGKKKKRSTSHLLSIESFIRASHRGLRSRVCMSGVFIQWRHIGDATLPASRVRCLFSPRGRYFFFSLCGVVGVMHAPRGSFTLRVYRVYVRLCSEGGRSRRVRVGERVRVVGLARSKRGGGGPSIDPRAPAAEWSGLSSRVCCSRAPSTTGL